MHGNPLPHFYALLRRAYDASERVDAYDLHSEDPRSVSRFTGLQADQSGSVLAIINHCRTHGNAMVAQIAEVPVLPTLDEDRCSECVVRSKCGQHPIACEIHESTGARL